MVISTVRHSIVLLNCITITSTDAVVAMAVSTDSVVESVGSVMVCVDSGISGNVETALTTTLAASEGIASE